MKPANRAGECQPGSLAAGRSLVRADNLIHVMRPGDIR
jgi:hypothetical protein